MTNRPPVGSRRQRRPPGTRTQAPWDIGDAGHPETIRVLRSEVPVHQIRGRPSILGTLRGSPLPSAGSTGQGVLANQTTDPLLVDHPSVIPEFGVHSWPTAGLSA